MLDTSRYTAVRTLPEYTHEAAVTAVTEALQSEGFGVLWAMDLQKIFGAKLGIAYRPYKVLGACNPPLAHRALLIDGNMGLNLPCNAVITEDDLGTVQVGVVDPRPLEDMTGREDLRDLLAEVHLKLLAALEKL
ncbi:MAG: DUF302 domain-containing protein [Deltaproteobacteria bacterium]|nr:DUF302 domain-containing protein [Deltaproteobacteria bacterium]